MKKNNLINNLKTYKPYEEIKALLTNCTHKQKVQFALLAAKSAEEFYDKEEYPEVHSSRLKVFELLEKWLENPKSVNKKELDKAAKAAYWTADAAARAADYAAAKTANKMAFISDRTAFYVAYTAAWAANVAANASANASTNAADWAAYYAAYAANAAYWTAHAAAYAVDVADAARNKRYQFLLFELIKLIAVNKGYNIATLEVLYGKV